MGVDPVVLPVLTDHSRGGAEGLADLSEDIVRIESVVLIQLSQ
jgi:hypothetical protein